MKIAYKLTFDEILDSTGGKAVAAGNGLSPLAFDEIFTDSREDFSGNAVFIAIKGKNFNGEDYVPQVFKKGAVCAVVSWDFLEKYSLSEFPDKLVIAVDDAIDALGKIAGYYAGKFKLSKKIAITGSCGKTTTKEMLFGIISGKYGADKVLKNEYNYNNLIGVPKAILGLKREHEYMVLEIGTNKKGEIEKLAGMISPDAGAITNIGKSHLLEFKDLAGVFEEKSSMFSHIKKGGIAVINAEDEMLAGKALELKEKTGLDIRSFGFGKAVSGGAGKNKDLIPDIVCENIVPDEKSSGSLITVSFEGRQYASQVAFRGKHLAADLMCALLLGHFCGVGIEDGLKASGGIVPPGGRMQSVVPLNEDYVLLNDSYNSNPDSLAAAIDSLADYYPEKKKIMVIGDMLELGDAAPKEHYNAGVKAAPFADAVFYKGDFAGDFKEGLKAGGFDAKNFFKLNNLENFKEIFKKIDKKDSVVLVKGSRGMKLEEFFPEELKKDVKSDKS